MSQILFANPKKAFEERRVELLEAISRSLDSGWYVLGPEVDSFEKEFAQWMSAGSDQVGESIGVANGTDAIELCLRALGAEEIKKPGRQPVVFTVSHTAVATVSAIERAGCTPVLIDIDEDTYTMDSVSLEAAVKSVIARNDSFQPFAVVPVHIYGHPCDLDGIVEIAEKYHLKVVEDCAQAHGAKWKGRNVGTIGHAAAFSFYPTKNLGALGDAGGIFTFDSALAARIRALRQYGWVERYISSESGINSRLDPVQAAVLRVQLPKLDGDNSKRQKIASSYLSRLNPEKYLLPSTSPDAQHVFHLFVTRVKNRDNLLNYMRNHGISLAIHYPQAVHQQPAYSSKIMVSPTGLLATEKIYKEIVSFPMYPQLTQSEIDHICETANRWE